MENVLDANWRWLTCSLLAGLVCGACGDDDGVNCPPAPKGQFEWRFEELAGNCGDDPGSAPRVLEPYSARGVLDPHVDEILPVKLVGKRGECATLTSTAKCGFEISSSCRVDLDRGDYDDYSTHHRTVSATLTPTEDGGVRGELVLEDRALDGDRGCSSTYAVVVTECGESCDSPKGGPEPPPPPEPKDSGAPAPDPEPQCKDPEILDFETSCGALCEAMTRCTDYACSGCEDDAGVDAHCTERCVEEYCLHGVVGGQPPELLMQCIECLASEQCTIAASCDEHCPWEILVDF